MKTIKILSITAVLFVGATSFVYASWWNPVTWKVFSRKVDYISQGVVSTSSLPVNGGNKNDIVKQKTQILKIESSEQDQNNLLISAKQKEAEYKKILIARQDEANKIREKMLAVSSSSNVVDKDSVYDINNLMDKDGNAIVITQVPNYKLTRIVSATRGGLKGFYYKDTKTFLTDKDLDEQAKASQDASDRQFSRGIYAQPVINSVQTNLPTNSQIKQEKLVKINQQIAALNVKYAQDVKDFYSGNAFVGTGATTAGVAHILEEINKKYQQDYNTLQAEWQQVYYGN